MTDALDRLDILDLDDDLADEDRLLRDTVRKFADDHGRACARLTNDSRDVVGHVRKSIGSRRSSASSRVAVVEHDDTLDSARKKSLGLIEPEARRQAEALNEHHRGPA